MAIKKTASGKVDKRTKEYKMMVENAKKARAARKGAKKTTTSSIKRTASGKIDKRTKEGKEIAARMAKARAAKNSFPNRLKRLFNI